MLYNILKDHISAPLCWVLDLNSCHRLGSLFGRVIPGWRFIHYLFQVIPGCEWWTIDFISLIPGGRMLWKNKCKPFVLTEAKVDCQKTVEKERQNQEQTTPSGKNEKLWNRKFAELHNQMQTTPYQRPMGKISLYNVHFNIKPQLLNYVTTLKSLFVQNNLGTKTRLKAIKNDVPSYVTFHLPLDIAGS